MTYAEFLLWFLILPASFLIVAGFCIHRSGRFTRLNMRHHWTGVAILACIGFVWTTPWDNYLIYQNVWDSAPERIRGRIGYVPIEEYAFFVLMPVLNGAVFFLIGITGKIRSVFDGLRQKKLRVIALVTASVLIGFGFLMLSYPRGSYLGLVLVWFTPPVAIQWYFDPAMLIREKRTVILSTLIPLFYLSLADRFAIQNGIWNISKDLTTGLNIFGLPIEEFFFFFVTSLLLAQGMVLWHGLKSEKSSQ